MARRSCGGSAQRRRGPCAWARGGARSWDARLAALRDAFASLGQGVPVAAFLHGRSGVGKSACVQRFLDGLAERGDVVVLAGRCYEQESVAYKALDTLIDALSRFLSGSAGTRPRP